MNQVLLPPCAISRFLSCIALHYICLELRYGGKQMVVRSLQRSLEHQEGLRSNQWAPSSLLLMVFFGLSCCLVSERIMAALMLFLRNVCLCVNVLILGMFKLRFTSNLGK